MLDGLAAENHHGAADYIEPNEDLEVKVSNFFAKVNYPVLSEIKIDWGGVETEKIYPRDIPDLFHGSQLVLIGRYHASRSHRLTITGKVNGQERRFVYDDAEFPETLAENEFLPQLWATRRVGYLMEQIRLSGESREVRDEIVELGTRYGIVTPYTSYLVLEPGMQARNVPQGRGGGAGSANQVVAQGGGEVFWTQSAPRIDAIGEIAVKDSKQKAENAQCREDRAPQGLRPQPLGTFAPLRARLSTCVMAFGRTANSRLTPSCPKPK